MKNWFFKKFLTVALFLPLLPILFIGWLQKKQVSRDINDLNNEPD